MREKEKIYRIAFSFLQGVNADIIREILNREISPVEFFTLPSKDLVRKLGIDHDHSLDKMKREEAVAMAAKEWEKINKHNIEVLFIADDDYPQNLAETEDAPVVLYKLGETDLEAEHMVSIVGTRKPTPYGADFCNKFVAELGDYLPDTVITSGLAFGIDAFSHKKALEKNLPTVAVVAHGLNMIYPAANRSLAKEIIKRGGAILSEYPFDVKPFKSNFLARNRIVAGLSDVTVIIESNIKGGAMSTANFAFQYNRDVMALPGRCSDEMSSGCNLLIRKQKAHLLSCVADLIEVTGWSPLGNPAGAMQRNLFPEIEGDPKLIYDILKYSNTPLHMDEIVHETGFTVSKALSLLGELEFDGIVIRYPGNRFSVS